MVIKYDIFKPHFNSRFKKFLKEYDYTISLLFDILKKYKPKIIDAYQYSIDQPPPHPLYKYTDKLFLACILFCVLYCPTWESFLGPIPGEQVNKRRLMYIQYDIFKKFFDTATQVSISELERKHKNTIKYVNIDTTINNNKLCKDITKHLPINKNRKGAKVSFLVNNRGIILSILIDDSSVHDSKFAIQHINDFFRKKRILKLIKKHKNKIYFLADSAYDNNEIKKTLNKINIRFIIKPNNKNTKDPHKRRYLTQAQKQIYKNRIKIEHCFGIIKRYPKINCVYERTLKSYEGNIFLIAGLLNLKKI